MWRYLNYLQGFIKDGLCCEGVADWLALLDVGDIVPREVLVTMFCGYVTALFRKIALLLGHTEDADVAGEWYAAIRNAYRQKYGALKLNCQALYAMELIYDFSDDRERTLALLIETLEKRKSSHVFGDRGMVLQSSGRISH